MYTSQASQTLIGRGKVLFDRFTSAGAHTGFRYLGDVSKFEITTKDDKASIYDYSVNQAPLMNEVVVKREVTVALTMHEFERENIALHLMGVEAAYTQVAGSVTAETLTTNAQLGHTYQTAFRNISAVVVHAGSTVLTAGADYQVVDAVTGLIMLMETSGAITAGVTITVDYTKATIGTPGLDRVQGANSSVIKGALLIVSDPANGPGWDGEFWLVTITPNGAMGLITAGDFGSMSLDCKVLADNVNHPTEPFYRLTRKS